MDYHLFLLLLHNMTDFLGNTSSRDPEILVSSYNIRNTNQDDLKLTYLHFKEQK